MKKKGHRPITKVKNPEPKMDDPDWIIWAAWADRITFEEIQKKVHVFPKYHQKFFLLMILVVFHKVLTLF